MDDRRARLLVLRGEGVYSPRAAASKKDSRWGVLRQEMLAQVRELVLDSY